MASAQESEDPPDFALAKYPILRPLFGMVFLESLGMALSAPVIPFFIMNDMGASNYELGLACSAFASTQILGAACFGRFSDAYGRWPVVVFSFVWTAIGCAATTYVQTFNELLLARFITGLSGGTWPICQAYLLDVVEIKDRGNYMGLLAAVFASAWIIGPGTASLLLEAHLVSRRTVFSISAVICLAGAFLGGVWLKESLPRDQWRPLFGKRPPQEDQARSGEVVTHSGDSEKKEESDWEAVNFGLVCMWLLRFFMAVAQFIVYTMYAPLLEDTFGLGARALGVLLACGGITAVIVQALVFGKVVRRCGRHEALLLGCCLISVAAVILPAMKVLAAHACVMLVLVVGEGFVEPGTPLVIAAYASSRHLGFANGWGCAFRGMAAIFAPLLAGILYEKCGACAFQLAGASAGVAGCLVVIAQRCGKEHAEDAEIATETTKLV